MPSLTRRGFLAASAAAVSVRALPNVVLKARPKHLLTLVYDKSIGAMRAIDRLVH